MAPSCPSPHLLLHRPLLVHLPRHLPRLHLLLLLLRHLHPHLLRPPHPHPHPHPLRLLLPQLLLLPVRPHPPLLPWLPPR